MSVIESLSERRTAFLGLVPQACVLLVAFFVLLPPKNCEIQVHLVYQVAVCLSVWAGYFAVFHGKQKKDRTLLLLALYVILVIVSTVINGNDVVAAIWEQGILCLTVFALFRVGIKRNERFFLCTFYLYLILILCLNCARFPFSGISFFYDAYIDKKELAGTETLIGHPNIQIFYMMLALYCGHYLYQTGYFSGKAAVVVYLLLYAGCIVCSVYFSCASNFITLSLWAVLLVGGRVFRRIRWINSWSVIAINVLIFLCLQLYNPESPGILKPLLDFIGRSPTFTGRTDIWAEARAYVASHVLYGAGYLDIYCGTAFNWAYHGHNVFVNAMIKCGLPGLIVLVAILASLAGEIARNKNTILQWGAVAFLMCVLLNLQFDMYYPWYMFCFAAVLSGTMCSENKFEYTEKRIQ